MYETFFNLERKPFELTANPDFLYLSGSHRKALLYLEYGIRERSAFVAITGDVGAGKTTLLRNLIRKYEESALICNIFHTCVTSRELLVMIAEGFGMSPVPRDKVRLLADLSQHLKTHLDQGRQPVLIIDEAQNLTAGTLEEVRMLSNLESDKGKFMQIILVGQPELRQTLCLPELLQLRQRISVNCNLRPLTKEESEQYILHRLEKAGNRNAVSFDRAATDIIFRYSRGIPRLINIICDFLLLAAFAESRRDIDASMVTDVVGEIDVERNFWGKGAGYPFSRPAEGFGREMPGIVREAETSEAQSAAHPPESVVQPSEPVPRGYFPGFAPINFFRRIFGIS